MNLAALALQPVGIARIRPTMLIGGGTPMPNVLPPVCLCCRPANTSSCTSAYANGGGLPPCSAETSSRSGPESRSFSSDPGAALYTLAQYGAEASITPPVPPG